MQSLFGSKNWKIHKDTLQHKRNAGEKCLSITKFFGPVKAEEKTNATGSVAPVPKECPGIYNPKKSNRLLKLMMMYGEKSDAIRIACIRGKFVAKVASCEGETVIRSSAFRKYYKRCCKSCFDSLEKRNSEANKFLRRVESMELVEKCVDLLTQGELKDYDIKILKKVLNWKQRDNEDFIALKGQIKHSVQFHEWKEVANERLSRLGINVKGKSTDEFINHFYDWYSKVPGARESLCMGMVKALVARHKNPKAPAAKKVIAFCHAMKIKSPKAYKFMRANGFGYAIRTLQNISAQNRVGDDLIFKVDLDSIKQRATKYICKAPDTLYGLAIDATKLVKVHEFSTAFSVALGGATPKHIVHVNANEESDSWMLAENQLADEVKCAVLTAQSCPANVTPFKAIAALPQITNQENDDYNETCVKAVIEAGGILVSVAFDGLSTEQRFIANKLLHFLRGNSRFVGVVDPNHVGKAIRSQLVLGGHFVTVGRRCFDVGLLKLAGISQDLYRVKDFASDAAVLELCTSKSIQKILRNPEIEHEDEGSVMVTLLCMLFLRIFIVTSSSSDVPKKQAMALLWSCLLFFTSIDMAMITKRNVVTSIVPMICLIAQRRVRKPRLLTSEPAEHYFGCARQYKREFSCSDFASYIENLEIALKQMVEYDLRNGGGKGYVAGFCSFLRDLVKSSNEPEAEEQHIFEGVNVNYTHVNVAHQIELAVLPCLNSIVEDMKIFLQLGFGINANKVSPFARSFEDFNDLAVTYYSYLPEKIRNGLKDHTFPVQDVYVSNSGKSLFF